MKKKGLTAVTLFVVTFLVIWFIPVHNRKEEPEKGEYQRIEEISETEAEGKAGQ